MSIQKLLFPGSFIHMLIVKRFLSLVTICTIFVIWVYIPICVLSVPSSSTPSSLNTAASPAEGTTTTNTEVSALGNSENDDNAMNQVSTVKNIVHLADLTSQYYDVKIHELLYTLKVRSQVFRLLQYTYHSIFHPLEIMLLPSRHDAVPLHRMLLISSVATFARRDACTIVD